MSSRNRFIIFLTVIVGFVLIMLLIFGGKKQDKGVTSAAPKKQIVLTDYAQRDSKVIFTTDGRINSDKDHRLIRVTVSRGSTLIEVVQGYQNNVIKSQRTDSNPDAYDAFIRSLARLNFARERKTSQPDPRGVCPFGYRYYFELIDNNDLKMRLWTTSCKGGTSAANSSNIAELFKEQVPDYAKFVNDVQL